MGTADGWVPIGYNDDGEAQVGETTLTSARRPNRKPTHTVRLVVRRTRVELAIKDLKAGGLAHSPSGSFTANAASLACAALAHNIARWTARIGRVHEPAKLTVGATIARRLLAVTGQAFLGVSGVGSLRCRRPDQSPSAAPVQPGSAPYAQICGFTLVSASPPLSVVDFAGDGRQRARVQSSVPESLIGTHRRNGSEPSEERHIECPQRVIRNLVDFSQHALC